MAHLFLPAGNFPQQSGQKSILSEEEQTLRRIQREGGKPQGQAELYFLGVNG
jgi:hypothetical protein